MLACSTSFAIAVALCSGAVLTGCGDTREQVAAMNLSIQKRHESAAAALSDRLIANPELVRTGDIQIYLSSSLAERALKLLDGLEYVVPDSGSIKITLGSARVTFTDGVAGVSLDMRASRGELSMKVLAAAVLLPEKNPARLLSAAELEALGPSDPSIPVPLGNFYRTSPLRFRVQITEIAPSATWGPFSKDIQGFVTEFSRLKINELLNNEALPAVELPFDQVVEWNQKEEIKDIPVEDKLTVRVTIPGFNWSTTFSIAEVVVLERGMHITGTLKRMYIENTKVAAR